MMKRLIATTSSREIRPLGFQGQSVIENWSVLRNLLRNRLGETFANFLAEPVGDTADGDIDWYTEAPEAPDERFFHRGQYEPMVASCVQLAATLRDSPHGEERNQGELLRLALTTPDERFIHQTVCGPVLVGWAHERVNAAPRAVELSGRGAAATPGRDQLPEPPTPPDASPPPVSSLPDPPSPPPAPALPPGIPPPMPIDTTQVAMLPHRLGMPPLATTLALVALAAVLLAIAVFWPHAATACHRRSVPLALAVVLLLALALLDGRVIGLATTSRDVRRARRLGTGVGQLQIMLAWNDLNDLDLHVLCPDGGHVSFERPLCSGGRLDRDANARRSGAPAPTSRPIENVFWAEPPPRGPYRVLVDPYEMHSGATSSYRIIVRRDGRTMTSTRGVVRAGQRMREACNFIV